MKELSLFSGSGGGLLATHYLLGWECIGYVEWDDYCQKVIAARIQDGLLPNAPIFGDIRAFNREGYSRAYTGMVDVITAGFPCQPFSVSGKQLGENDVRNMWPETIDVIRTVEPEWVFLENVPGLVSSGYVVTILNELRESGYSSFPPLTLSASDIGANHQRKRIWLVAHAPSKRAGRLSVRSRRQGEAATDPVGCCENVANTHGSRCDATNEIQSDSYGQWDGPPSEQAGNIEPCEFASNSKTVADAQSERCREDVSNPEYQRDGWRQFLKKDSEGTGGFCYSQWWQTEPDVGRVVDGVAHRVDRLRALGNGQVPGVATAAWRLLIQCLPEP